MMKEIIELDNTTVFKSSKYAAYYAYHNGYCPTIDGAKKFFDNLAANKEVKKYGHSWVKKTYEE